MIKWIKKRRETAKLRREEAEVASRVEKLRGRAELRKEGAWDEFRPIDNYLNAKEKQEFRDLVYRHQILSFTLFGEDSPWWSPKQYWDPEDPASPEAYLQVTEDRSVKAKIEKPEKMSDEQWSNIWRRDDEFEFKFREWMKENNLKFWSQMTPRERWEQRDRVYRNKNG